MRPTPSRRARPILLAALSLPVIVLALGFCVGSPRYYSDKYSPADTAARPTHLPTAIAPEVQTEPHTCGLHSLSSLYQAYGLDPQAQRLRFRLGTDMPANTLAPSTRGTIHPDMLRVLHQDGFETDVLLPGSDDTPARLRDHLDAGHFAVILIKVTEFHWVVAARREADDLVICDSLRPELYPVPLEPYLRDEVYSLLLVRPRR